MLVYWLLFAYFAVGAVLRREGADQGLSSFFLNVGGVAIALLIGLRFEVGGDWGAYQRMFSMASYAGLEDMLRFGDPAYQSLSWSVQRIGGPLWLVNLICGAIFSWGLLRFAKGQENPWLAMLIAVPYLVIVVGMGYTRQATAIGIIMMGLAAIQRGASVLRFALYVAVAAMFHKTAVVALLLVALTGRRNTFGNLLVITSVVLLLYDSLLQDQMARLVRNYITAQYNSQGAAIRISMSLLPAALFLLRRRSFAFNRQSDALWRNFSLGSIVLLVALLVLPSSTVVDRMALYLLPLQLAVLSQLPRVLRSGPIGRFLVVGYAFAIQFTWLNFADNAGYWVPYSNYLWS